MPTLQQEKVAKIMFDIVRNPEKGKVFDTKGKILKAANYSEKSARQPSRVFESQGLKKCLAALMKDLKIDKDSRLERLAEIMWDKDKRSSLAAIAELNKMTGDYAPVKQEIDDLRDNRSEIITPE